MNRCASFARLRAWLRVLLTCLIVATHAAAAPETPRSKPPSTGLMPWSADERAAVLRHGPWPQAPAADAGHAGNRWAASPAAQKLGKALFFDPRLSGSGAVSCASCHQSQRAFTDGLRRSVALAEVIQGTRTGAAVGLASDGLLERNTPSLINAAQQRWMGWDGAADSLWFQALRPVLNPREMGGSLAQMRAVVLADQALSQQFRRAFGQPASALDDEAAAVLMAKAIAAYIGTLTSERTPFDAFRDALARGDDRAAARYPMAAQRGLKLFVGRAQCALCHVGPQFTHGEFADIGLPFFVRPGQVDPGRQAGILALLDSRYNLLGPFADRPQGAATNDAARNKTALLSPQHRNFGEFKVPGLRGVAQTAPYMHDGQLPDLSAVVRHYTQLNPERLHTDGEQILRPLDLTPDEQQDLVQFLHSLSPQGRHDDQTRLRDPERKKLR